MKNRDYMLPIDFMLLGEKLYGKDQDKWEHRCPKCNNVSTEYESCKECGYKSYGFLKYDCYKILYGGGILYVFPFAKDKEGKE